MQPLPPALDGAQVAALLPLLTPGTVFDTPFERGCIVLTAPDSYGVFSAADSDGVPCAFALCAGAMPIYIVGEGSPCNR